MSYSPFTTVLLGITSILQMKQTEKLRHLFRLGYEAEPAFELESENRNLVAAIQENGGCYFFPLDVLKLSLQLSFIKHFFIFNARKIRSNFLFH